MKIIDLLNTPLDELPKKIKVEDKTYTLFIDEDTDYHYYQDDKCKYFMFSISCFDELNEEVEIIEDKPFNKRVEEIYNRHMDYIYGKEDKKIEKIKILNCDDYVKKENYETILTMQEIALDIQTLKNKINEIIDYLEEKE